MCPPPPGKCLFFKRESLSFTQTANVRLMLTMCLKTENEQIKKLKAILLDKKLRETTNLCVEITNSKRQEMGELGHVVQIGLKAVIS